MSSTSTAAFSQPTSSRVSRSSSSVQPAVASRDESLFHSGSMEPQVLALDFEVVYALGYDLLQRGRYDRALNCFELLVREASYDSRYWSGLAYVYKSLKRYDDAILAYCLLANREENSAHSMLRVAECQLLAGSYPGAIATLKMIVDIAGDSVAHAEVVSRARALMALVHHDTAPA